MNLSALRLALLASTLVAAPALAAMPTDAAADAAADVAATEDAEIVVYGKGEVRQVTEIKADDIRLTVPGASPFIAIQKLPGVNFQSADPFGVYEWSTRITLRGFNQNQLGFTLDGVPLGDMSYGNTNGLHISRAIIADNIGRTRVSQGAGALGTASTSNLGGTIEFFSRAPQDELGIAANATYGDNDTLRLFGTLDTGDLGGFKAYLSAAYLTADKWKGVGVQRATQVNAKAVATLADDVTFTAFVNFTDRKENDYQDFSQEMLGRLGYFADNISDNWPLAVRLAFIGANRGNTGVAVGPNSFGTVFPAPYTSVDDAYFDAAGLRRDWLAGGRLEGKLTDQVTAGVQLYYHSNKGQGSWITPYRASPGGLPLSFRTTEYEISRIGVLGDVTATLGANTLRLNVWYENVDFEQARRFYDMGTSQTTPLTSALTYQSNPFFTQWNNDYNTRTFQFAVQDQWDVSDAFSISVGVKGQSVKLRAAAINPVPGPLALGRIKSEDLFMPQVGLLYKLGGGNELFANFTENQRAFTAAATTGPFATSAAGFAVIASQLRPEKTNTFEGGFRFGEGRLSGVVAAYLVNFSNRLLSIPQGPGIVGNASLLSNVGDVRSIGAEIGLQWQPVKAFTATASYAYNENTYRDDVRNAAGTVIQAIRGRTVVDSPRSIANLELAYDDGHFYGRANANAMSGRFFTFSNDREVGGRVVVDGKIGYRVTSDNRWLNGLAIEASASNLFDRRYVATIGSNGFGFSGDNQTLLPAAPRQFFLTLRKDF
ncbi:TonB-dependent receptor [Sandarakinorhabdus cyanobacteriorum]|uniref:TonB-dependent receptor n=1 Tax=Sandarakinorhabdus cyanobacteriorum TaxID=1981098 RepID=A0A255YN56_9SPHN|nr:TonB-dependent receptor [Sandarakinorhabdus cyanobacteriorum]OYQ30686.1 TonB-dependent receptor [Sandarakinorhabdus cyanobacteriorum]